MRPLIIFAAEYLYLLIVGGAALVWATSPAQAKRSFAMHGLLAGVIATVMATLAGAVYYDPRPFVASQFTPLVSHVADNGFPSHHAALTLTVALVVLQVSRRWGIVLIIGALVIAGARIAAGLHSPLQIGAGIAIAIIATMLSWWIVRRPARSF